MASEAERTLDESQLSHYFDGTSFGEFIDGIYKKHGLYEDNLDHSHQPFGAFDTQHRYTKANVRHLLKNMKMLNQELFDSVPDDQDLLSSYLHIYYRTGNPHYYYDDASFFEKIGRRSKSKTETELKELLERVSNENTALPLYTEWEAVFKYGPRYYTLYQKPKFTGIKEEITPEVNYDYPNVLFGVILYSHACEPLAYSILKTSEENDSMFKLQVQKQLGSERKQIETK